MGMFFNNIEFPREVIDALRNNELVLFVGAGVSAGRRINLPLFDKLAEEIAKGTILTKRPKETIDHFLGRLSDAQIPIAQRTKEMLSTSEYNDIHVFLLKLFSNPKDIKIVTTNFDLAFENAAAQNQIVIPQVTCPNKLLKG